MELEPRQASRNSIAGQEEASRTIQHSKSDMVYLLEHVIDLGSETERIRTIGIYTSESEARAAIARLRDRPGFSDYPELFDPGEDDITSGFCIDAYQLDEDNWAEGFGIEWP